MNNITINEQVIYRLYGAELHTTLYKVAYRCWSGEVDGILIGGLRRVIGNLLDINLRSCIHMSLISGAAAGTKLL